MKSKRNATIIAGTAVITTLATSLGWHTVLHHNDNDFALNNEVKEDRVIMKSERKETQSSYDKVKEINKNNIKLIVFESSKGNYERVLKTDQLFDVTSRLQTTYSYNAVLDMSKAAYVYQVKGITYVEVDLSQIKLNNINIEEPIVKTDMNFFNQFKGRTIEDNMNQLVVLSYDHIEKLVDEQFEDNHSKIERNAQDKIRSLYNNLDNVVIKFK